MPFKINGKKRYIIPLTVVVPIAIWLFTMQFGYNERVIANETTLGSHASAIKDLKETPVKIARLEENVEAIQEDVGEMKNDIKQILMAVTSDNR